MARGTAIPEIPHSFLAEQCVERPAAVKGARKARAQRPLEGEDRSAKIPREGMALSFVRLLRKGRLFIMRVIAC
jgi:hypothetical protein